MRESFKLNSKGFSLVAALVSMGIMGLVAVGFMKLTKVQTKSSNYFETRANERELVENIRLILRDSRACVANLNDNPLPNNPQGRVELNQIVTVNDNGDETVVVDPDEPGRYGLDEISLFVTNPYGIAPNTRGPFVIEANIVRKDNQIGIKNKTERILLDIQVNNLYQVISCFTDEENAINTTIKEICEQAGGKVKVLDPPTPEGRKYECVFFDLYLGMHNQAQCAALSPAGSNLSTILRNDGNNTFCYVHESYPGWNAANKTWNQYQNYFSSKRPTIDCTSTDFGPRNVTAANITDYINGTGDMTNFDLSTGTEVASNCNSVPEQAFGNHASLNNCQVTCRYDRIDQPGTTVDRTMTVDFVINALGVY